MRQDARQVGVEALVDGEETLGAHGFGQAVPNAGVEVSALVVHPGHYRVFMNDRAGRLS